MEDLTGKQLGSYQVVAPLGEGGMAAVYKAYQPKMERHVALKVLPRYFASDPQFVGRFEQEAKVLANLLHPHILPVHDYGESDGYTYIVMPFVESGTLADLLGQPLPLAQIQRIVTQVGEALDYAHSQGLIHRDVKPSNILIDPSGNCLLTDFGIAKMVEGTAHFTRTGGIVGTPAYMSPEQIQGEILDGRSDVYSLGIVLYEMATGRPPYRAETPPAIFVKHLHDPLPPPRTLNPALPEAVELVILKALAKKREDRYATAGDVVRGLRAAAEAVAISTETGVIPDDEAVETAIIDQPPTARPAGPGTAHPPVSSAKPSRPSWKPILVAVGAVMAVGVIGLVALAIWLAGTLRGDRVAVDLTATPRVSAIESVVPEVTDTPAGSVPSPVPDVEGTQLAEVHNAQTAEADATQTIQARRTAARQTATALAARTTQTAATRATQTAQAPTASPVPPPTRAPAPTPTPVPSLPGRETIPLADLAPGIPWLPLDENSVPATYFYGFNVAKPPFDHRLVRQAFALAVDRQAVADVANSFGSNQARPATTFTPPETLGRDLYGQMGLPFDPGRARELLAQAGYPNGEGFPQVTLAYNYTEGHGAIANAVVAMWRDHLGINVGLEPVDDWTTYRDRVYADAPAIFRMGWAVDYNDPDNCFVPLFSEDHMGNFDNADYTRLVEQAAAAADDPPARQALYIQAERILCEQEAAIIPLYHYYVKFE